MAKDKGHLVIADDPKNDVAISVEGVYKSFKLPHNRQNSIKGSIINLVAKGDRSFETQEVLKDISFQIKKGEFFGIVGRNGSGKSTLLKMLAGIYTPTSGKIIVNGSLTPFIELGVGFNPQLTGRENVYLNGALLGFSDKEVTAMYKDIVQFAELERFMDQRLKNYSSGMQVRLAFSIAIRARSDILLLDEVLAVGDEAFQRKCFAYFETLKRNKKTVILVTHDMGAVERFCNRAMFIEEGNIRQIGSAHDIAAAYSRANDVGYESSALPAEEAAEAKKSSISITLKNSSGKVSRVFTSGDVMTVELSWPQTDVQYAGVSILKNSGEYVYGQNMYNENIPLKGAQSIAYDITLDVIEGEYFIVAGLFGSNDSIKIDYEEHGAQFVVHRNKAEARWGGIVKLPHKWRQLP